MRQLKNVNHKLALAESEELAEMIDKSMVKVPSIKKLKNLKNINQKPKKYMKK
jgi:hypothetical protein